MIFQKGSATGMGASVAAGAMPDLDRHPQRWSFNASGVAVIVFLAAILSIWTVCAQFMPPVLLPGPERVLRRFIDMWFNAAFQHYALATVFHVVAAVVLSFVIGLVVALLGYFYPVLDIAIYGRLAPFLNSFSGVGWAFLALIWIGINDGAVIFSATISLLPLTVINLGAGLKALNGEITEMSISFGRNPWRRIGLVILPLMFPYMLATLRLLFGISWQIVLVGELLCGAGGLGTLISISRQRFATDTILAIALLIFALVYLLDRVFFARVQRKLGMNYDV